MSLSAVEPRQTVRAGPEWDEGHDEAWVGGWHARRLVELTDEPAVLDTRGFWVVLLTFEGRLTCARFADVRPSPAPPPAPCWPGLPALPVWTTSLDEAAYQRGVTHVRTAVAEGDVYQANLCRVLSVAAPTADLRGLGTSLAAANPSPHAGWVHLPSADAFVASASPETFLRRDGDRVASGPIKGTARDRGGLSAKDRAENVMIVDLVRNDLGRVAQVGSVEVTRLCTVERHPGLVHLVSEVTARLRPGAGWAALLAAAAPAGSVSGAPKSSALRLIRRLEPVPRDLYCGGIGWVDADRRTGCLAVGIRTFWSRGSMLRFGTGAGITWGSDPAREWEETELKARRLLAITSRPAGSVSGRLSVPAGSAAWSEGERALGRLP